MRVLVTGGAGFIGSHIVDAFVDRDWNVSVYDNLSTGSSDNLNPKAELFESDVRDKKAVFAAFEQATPELVVHLAAQADVRRSMDDPAYDADVNLIGMLHLLEASKRFGTQRFVFASTGGAIYGEPKTLPVAESTKPTPLSCYGASKLAAEGYLGVYAESCGLRSTTLRYANVYGPRQNPKGEAGVVAIFSRQILGNDTPTIFGDGSKTRDYVFVEDIVNANLLSIDGEADGIFNIGTGERITDQEVFTQIRDAVGSDVEAKHGLKRSGEVEHICLDASHAGEVFGWKPGVSFSEGIKRSVEYYRAQTT